MNRTIILLAAASLASAAASGRVFAQVVADSACPKYAVDIASFATCDGDRVAREDAKQEPRRQVDTAAAAARSVGKEASVVDATNAGSKTSPATRSRKTRTNSNVDRPAK